MWQTNVNIKPSFSAAPGRQLALDVTGLGVAQLPSDENITPGQLCVPSYCKSVKSGQVLLRIITAVLSAFLRLLTVTPLQQFQHFLYDSLEGPTQILAAVGFC